MPTPGDFQHHSMGGTSRALRADKGLEGGSGFGRGVQASLLRAKVILLTVTRPSMKRPGSTVYGCLCAKPKASKATQGWVC